MRQERILTAVIGILTAWLSSSGAQTPSAGSCPDFRVNNNGTVPFAAVVAPLPPVVAETIAIPPAPLPPPWEKEMDLVSRNNPRPSIPSPSSIPALTLGDLEAMALRCNPTLAQSAAQIEAARGKFDQGGLYPNPRLGYQADEMGDEGRSGQQGGFIEQRIVTAGKLRWNQQVAAGEISQAEWAWHAQRLRVLNDVRRAYYAFLVARQALEVHGELVRIGREGLKTTEALLKAQEVSRVPILQARIEAETSELSRQNAENRLQAAARRLAATVGMTAVDPNAVAGRLDAPPPRFTWAESLGRLCSESPQRAQAQAGVGRARSAVQRAYAGRVPDVDMQAKLQFDNATENTIAGVSLGVPLPLFDRNQGNIRRAYAELTAAESEVRRVELRLQEQLAGTFQQYENARQQTEKYSSVILPDARKTLDLVLLGYRQGEYPYLELLTVQRTYYQVNLAYLDSLQSLWENVVLLEGCILTGGLEVSFAPASSGGEESK
jgi:outer membrane protein, heavy metal efflux system